MISESKCSGRFAMRGFGQQAWLKKTDMMFRMLARDGRAMGSRRKSGEFQVCRGFGSSVTLILSITSL